MSKPGPRISSIIEAMADDLPAGASRNRLVCPYCQGGDNSDRSFSITNNGAGLLFNCYRDSCRRVHMSSGFITGAGHHFAPSEYASVIPEFIPRPYVKPLVRLTACDRELLWNWYFLQPGTLGAFDVRYSPGDERYVLPVKSPYGLERGVITKIPPGTVGDGPKSISYRELPGPWIAWYLPNGTRSQRLTLVEDQWSAMRLYQAGEAAAAILGTTLAPEAAREIAAMEWKEIGVALDADATSSAVQLVMDNGLLLPMAHVIQLPLDIKNMPLGDELKIFRQSKCSAPSGDGPTVVCDGGG